MRRIVKGAEEGLRVVTAHFHTWFAYIRRYFVFPRVQEQLELVSRYLSRFFLKPLGHTG